MLMSFFVQRIQTNAKQLPNNYRKKNQIIANKPYKYLHNKIPFHLQFLSNNIYYKGKKKLALICHVVSILLYKT